MATTILPGTRQHVQMADWLRPPALAPEMAAALDALLLLDADCDRLKSTIRVARDRIHDGRVSTLIDIAILFAEDETCGLIGLSSVFGEMDRADRAAEMAAARERGIEGVVA